MAPRNPPWTRDELILTLDMYFQQGPSHISASHPTVTSLSESLNRLPVHSVRPDAERFRNANGVYMKLSNFLRFDDSYAGSGLTHGGKLEEEVWNEFASDKFTPPERRIRNQGSGRECWHRRCHNIGDWRRLPGSRRKHPGWIPSLSRAKLKSGPEKESPSPQQNRGSRLRSMRVCIQ